MAAPDEDVYTLCLGTDPQVSKDAARLRAHDTHDAGVRLALEVDDQARLWLEDYVNHGKIPKPEEIKLFWNAFVDKHMDLVGDDHGNCGNPLDEKKYHVSLNFNTEAHKKRCPGQTRGDRIALNNHTFVFLRHYAVYTALLEGGTPEGELTPAIAAKAFDSLVSYSDYYQISCDGTPKCPRGNKWRECFEPQLVKDAKKRRLSGKTKAEKLCVHNLQARSALAVRALHSIAVGNEKLTVLMASDRSNEKLFKNPNRDIIDALLVHIFLTSHPSTFPAQLQHPGVYPREELERMTKHFLKFLQVVFAGAVLSNGTQLSLPSSAEEFKLFFKLAGHGDLSPAEMEALLEALHEGRVRGGTTTAYSKGLDARGYCVAMVERGGSTVLPATELMHSTILRLANDRDWDMYLPGGALLSEVCEINNVELRQFHLAHGMAPVDIVRHEPALVEHRCLTDEEKAAIRSDANGDVDEALKNAAKAKVKQFVDGFRTPRARAETALILSDQAVPALLWTRGACHLTQLIENTIHNLAKDLSYRLPAKRSLPNNRKLSDNVAERQCEITHALKPKDLILVNPALGLGPLDDLGQKLRNVRTRATAARKKAAEQAAAEQAAADQDESSLLESSEDFVPQYGMRVGVEFDEKFDLGTITGVNEEGSSFRLRVWFDDGSEYADILYPAADVRFVEGSDGRPVFDAAHLAFLENPRYATMMEVASERNILLAPSGIAVCPSTITPRCSDDSSGDEGVAAADFAPSVRPTVSSVEQKTAKGSKRKLEEDPAPSSARPTVTSGNLPPPLPPPVLEPGSSARSSEVSYPCDPTHFDPASISYYGHPRSNSPWDIDLHYNFNQSYLVNQRYDYLCPIPPDWKKRLDEMRAAESAQLKQSDVQPPVAADPAVLQLTLQKKRRLEETPAVGRRAEMTFDCRQRYQGTIIGVAELAFGKFSLALLLDDETVEHGVLFPADDIRLLKSCNGEPLTISDTDYLSQWVGFDVNDARAIEEVDELKAVTASLFK